MEGSRQDSDAAVLMLGEGWFPEQLGGLNRYFRDLFESLPEAHAVVVGPGPVDLPNLSVASDRGAFILWRLARFARTATRQAANADMVDAHFALYAFLPALSPRLQRKPWMVHFQGPWATESVAAGDASRWAYLIRKRIERTVYRRSHATVTLTSAFRQLLCEQYGTSPWNVHVIPPGVDTERFGAGDRAAARSRLGLADEDFVVCCVRRLTARMGLSVLLAAWSELSIREPRAKLVIAGDGELRSQLETEITSRSLTGSVQLLGRISDDELVDLYAAADLNVVPSVSLEGFGLIVLEAAAAGTPSIVSRAGGLPEAIAGLGTDLVVEAGHAGQLADRLRAAVNGELPTRAQTADWGASRSLTELGHRHRDLQESLLSPLAAPRKPRVVYLDHVASLSGGELALLRLLQATTEVDVHVILAEDGPLVSRLNESGISVEVLQMPERARSLRRGAVSSRTLPLGAAVDTTRYSIRLARRLRRIRPDIVHANSLKAGVYGLLASRLARTRFVWSLHDRLVPEYVPTLGRQLLSRLAGAADAVICNSETTRSTLAAPASAFVIAPPVATAALAQDPVAGRTQPPAEGLNFGIVGRLAPWKGQDVFITAFARAFPHGPHRARIIGEAMFGAEEESFAASLTVLSDRLGVSDRIEFRGFREDIPAELRSLDVLVHASTIPEPFGQVVAEGMAAGLTVLAVDDGGPAEMIEDRKSGILYPARDVEALSKAMREAAELGPERAEMSAAAVRTAQQFAPELAAQRVWGVYEQVLSARRR